MADNQDKLYNGYIQMIKRNELFYENLLQSDLKYLLVFCALFRYIELNADKYKFFDKIYAVKNLRLLYGQTISRYELIDYISKFEKAHEIENGLLSENFRTLTNDIGNEFGFPPEEDTDNPEPEPGETNDVDFVISELFGIINNAALEEGELSYSLRNVFLGEDEEMKYLFERIVSLPASISNRLLIYDNCFMPSWISSMAEITVITNKRARAVDKIMQIISGSIKTAKWFESGDEYLNAIQSDDRNKYAGGHPVAYSRVPDQTYTNEYISYEDLQSVVNERVELLLRYIEQNGTAYFVINKDFLSNTSFKELRKALIDADQIEKIISCSENALLVLVHRNSGSKIEMIDSAMSDNAENSNNGASSLFSTVSSFEDKIFKVTKSEITAHDYDLRHESYMPELVKESLNIKNLTGKLERHYKRLASLIKEFGKLDG